MLSTQPTTVVPLMDRLGDDAVDVDEHHAGRRRDRSTMEVERDTEMGDEVEVQEEEEERDEFGRVRRRARLRSPSPPRWRDRGHPDDLDDFGHRALPLPPLRPRGTRGDDRRDTDRYSSRRPPHHPHHDDHDFDHRQRPPFYDERHAHFDPLPLPQSFRRPMYPRSVPPFPGLHQQHHQQYRRRSHARVMRDPFADLDLGKGFLPTFDLSDRRHDLPPRAFVFGEQRSRPPPRVVLSEEDKVVRSLRSVIVQCTFRKWLAVSDSQLTTIAEDVELDAAAILGRLHTHKEVIMDAFTQWYPLFTSCDILAKFLLTIKVLSNSQRKCMCTRRWWVC